MLTNWLVGGAALTGIIAAWNYIKGWWSYLASYVIVRVELNHQVSMAVAEYCRRNFSLSPYGPKNYAGSYLPLRKTRRKSLVPYQELNAKQLFWKGWRPIWLGETAIGANGHGGNNTITFFRGTLNLEQLLIESCKYLNELRQGSERKRFKVETLGGKWSSATMASRSRNQSEASPQGMAWDEEGGRTSWDLFGYRLLGCTPEDIGIDGEHSCRLSDLALYPEAQELVDTVRRWYRNREWYADRRVPWKFGFRLVGLPGCGKTALTRAIAYEHDLPVYAFDLATMDNDDLREAWGIAMASTPCVVLFEDIDSVFDGRTPVNERSPLTFDTLLQCLDGVEQHDGVLAVVTTNYKAKLDPALTRPGRTDVEVEMLPPTRDGRLKIATRILGDQLTENQIIDIVDAYDGKTGAEFQYECSQIALSHFWKRPGRPVGSADAADTLPENGHGAFDLPHRPRSDSEASAAESQGREANGPDRETGKPAPSNNHLPFTGAIT